MGITYHIKKLLHIKPKVTTKDISLSLCCSGVGAGTIRAIAADDGENYCELALSGYPIIEDAGALVGKKLHWNRVPEWRKKQMVKDKKLAVTWNAVKGYIA